MNKNTQRVLGLIFLLFFLSNGITFGQKQFGNHSQGDVETDKSTLSSSKPNLSCPWTSSYGKIYWKEGYYDNNTKTISGNLYQKDGTWVYEGKWGRKDDLNRCGKVYFEFTSDTTFTGYWTEGGSQKQTKWEGAGKCEVPKPNLSCPWKSDHGRIDWEKGFYGAASKTISGSLSLKDGVWVYEGTWGRTNSNRTGKVYFKFTSATTFTGYWTEGHSKKKNKWNGFGECKVAKPDLSCTWDSNNGKIYWNSGYYGATSKTISGDLSLKDGVWVYEGTWGRRDGSRSGKVYFKFMSATTFTGYWTENSNGKQNNWTGSEACE